ncbi:GNAT family acetyltransferase [Sphingomonas fuzhouensis]|uniref:GNAT family acetyltransferase n=1 Tax=Sphingomonas fuzhouensis TaxID=3106033 RepID=UPI002AFED126|nr:GNAT family acetyltransferase [Sphingomonas sp. SGZ-02]
MEIGELIDMETGSVVELWQRCDLTRPWNDPFADIAHARRTADAVVLVGREGSAIVASIMVGFDGHRGWVYYLAVDPALQRRGYGRAMMAAAETWLRDRSAPKLQLMVRDTNLAALGFYERLGFERQPVATLGKRLDGRT